MADFPKLPGLILTISGSSQGMWVPAGSETSHYPLPTIQALCSLACCRVPPGWSDKFLQGRVKNKAILIYLTQCTPESSHFLPAPMLSAMSANHLERYLFTILN